MIRLRVNPHAVTVDQLVAAVSALRSGGIVAFPTETFYGLACDPRSAFAIKKIFALKQRSPEQPLPLIAASVAQVRHHVGVMTPVAERLAARAWPGPLTLIIPASSELCSEVHLSTGKIAVRVSGDPLARALAEAAGHAITSTSANLSGKPPACTPDVVAASFEDGLDVLLDAGATPGGLPSTIVDATGADPVLVRAGGVSWDRVLEFWAD
jgi:L-threonylcarbamoyladenylate synthase